MNKRLLCPNCGLKNLIWKVDCKHCGIDMITYLRRNPFLEAEILELGPNTIQQIAGISFLLFLATVFRTSVLATVWLNAMVIVFLVVLIVSITVLRIEKIFLNDLRAVGQTMSIKQARQVYERYLNLGPENGTAECAEKRCNNRTLVHCNYCKEHWFYRLEGQKGVRLLNAYRTYGVVRYDK